MENSLIIDAHVHILAEGFWPAQWFDWVAYSWARSRPPYRDPAVVRPRIESGLTDPDGSRMVPDMDAAGVDTAVILPIDWGPDFDQGRSVPPDRVVEHAAGLQAKYPGRFIAFAGIDPRRPKAPELLEWAIRKLGVRGLKLYPPMGFYPYDKAAYPLYELCEAEELPVLFHTGELSLAITAPRFANPLYVQEVQARFPRLIVWLGHAGAKLWWDEAVTVAANGVNSYLELSVWIYHDTTEEEEELFLRRLALARDRLGPHRLLFGSDHVSGARVRGRAFLPKIVRWFEDLPERAAKLGISFTDEEMQLIMGGNAARCLRLHTPSS